MAWAALEKDLGKPHDESFGFSSIVNKINVSQKHAKGWEYRKSLRSQSSVKEGNSTVRSNYLETDRRRSL